MESGSKTEENVGYSSITAKKAQLQSMLSALLDDPILSDVPRKPTLADVDTLINLELGSAMKISVTKMDNTSFDVAVLNSATVKDLKLAIRKKINEIEQAKMGHRHISWRHVWANFCLAHHNEKLIDDNSMLTEYGIHNNSKDPPVPGNIFVSGKVVFVAYPCIRQRCTFSRTSCLGHPRNIPRERSTGFSMVSVNDHRVGRPLQERKVYAPSQKATTYGSWYTSNSGLLQKKPYNLHNSASPSSVQGVERRFGSPECHHSSPTSKGYNRDTGGFQFTIKSSSHPLGPALRWEDKCRGTAASAVPPPRDTGPLMDFRWLMNHFLGFGGYRLHGRWPQ
ncbi:U11 U12 small nuclear ribonucleoprotein 25 kDa [Musa troglodytarum]|uniref:U11 U12 small nuclear ribonucleoprotein 25 kDa n=1 Tax=Musa troglodytarum TaxID=320322 RepID=A0A9E7HW00_9LILI|nr:U11 U12 small nuclear ribonucleoprotein 25 kDa [Musa troglodytarum]